MTAQVPFHKSERMFRRYEQHIFQFTIHYPKVIGFDPMPLACTTFSCRLRDAIASVLEYNWPTCLDVARLREIWPLSSVRVGPDGFVYIGPNDVKEAGPLSAAGHQIDVNKKDDFAFDVDNPPLSVLIAFCVLLENKVLKRPVRVRNVARATMTQLSEKFDVGISESLDCFILL